MQRYGLHISLAILLGLTALMLLDGMRGHSSDHEMVGASALDFRLPVLHVGEPISTGRVGPQDHRGDVILIDFWAMYCEPCRDSMPDLQRLHEVYRGRDFALLSVNVDPLQPGVDRPGLITEFFRRHGYTFPVLLDYGPAAEAYDVTSIPYLVVIDRRGQVRFVHTRPASFGALSDEIDTLLREPEPS